MGRHTTPRKPLTPKQRFAAALSAGSLVGIGLFGAFLTPLAQATDSSPLPPDVDPTSVDVTATDGTSVRVINATLSLTTTVDKPVVTPGSRITYTYKVTAMGGNFGSLRVTDDKCEPVTGPTGDNGDRVLQPGETWVYGCSTTVSKDVTNAARVTGRLILDGTTASPTPTPTPSSPAAMLKDGTYLGPVTAISIPGENSNYSIQVQAVVSGGRITAVTSTYPTPATNGTSRFLVAGAEPTLISEALAAQSASIANVSGATYTSAGFKTSLAAALTAARA